MQRLVGVPKEGPVWMDWGTVYGLPLGRWAGAPTNGENNNYHFLPTSEDQKRGEAVIMVGLPQTLQSWPAPELTSPEMEPHICSSGKTRAAFMQGKKGGTHAPHS